MHHRRRTIELVMTLSCCLAALAGVPALSASAQTADPELKVVDVDIARYPEIGVLVTVPMVFSGRVLGADDFEIMQDGLRSPVEVTAFDPTALELVTVVDPTIPGSSFLTAQGVRPVQPEPVAPSGAGRHQ